MDDQEFGELKSDVTHIKDAVEKMETALNNGIKSRVTSNTIHIKIMWAFAFVHTTSLLGLAYYILKIGINNV